MAVKLSYIKKICSYKTLLDIQKVYNLNNLNYRVNNFFKKNRDHNTARTYFFGTTQAEPNSTRKMYIRALCKALMLLKNGVQLRENSSIAQGKQTPLFD